MIIDALSYSIQSKKCNVFHYFQLRREKVELENSLEQEQESLVNRLWKRMDKLEAEKRYDAFWYISDTQCAALYMADLSMTKFCISIDELSRPMHPQFFV